MIKVGITGGIGSGKSLACEIFSRLGVSVYNADCRAKWLMNNNTLLKQKLITRWGNQVYKNDQLDRSYLAGIIFEDKNAVEYVNSLVHPAVKIDFRDWCSLHLDDDYVIEEAALLFESNSYLDMDIMVTVFSNEKVRIDRVCKRDHVTKEQVIQRMNNQLPDEEKIKRSEFVIYNSNEQSMLEQVIKLHHTLISRKK